ncbi:MAG: 2-phospho-L-lactate transferase CofD family protein, partial [Candidatus Promineifilaceae bacterium]
GVISAERGWGLEGETWNTLRRVNELGGPNWFNLGDLDLATHLTRTHWLREGETLTKITQRLCEKIGLSVKLLPMSNDLAPTIIKTADGELAFQEWFVGKRWQPLVQEVKLPDVVRATPEVIWAIKRADVVLIGPSNPFVSIAPILNSYPIRPILADEKARVVAVSPLIAGKAVKGPTAKMMNDWGMDVSAEAVIRYYGDVLSGFVYDKHDKHAPNVADIALTATDTLMKTDADRVRVAKAVLDFAMRI